MISTSTFSPLVNTPSQSAAHSKSSSVSSDNVSSRALSGPVTPPLPESPFNEESSFNEESPFDEFSFSVSPFTVTPSPIPTSPEANNDLPRSGTTIVYLNGRVVEREIGCPNSPIILSLNHGIRYVSEQSPLNPNAQASKTKSSFFNKIVENAVNFDFPRILRISSIFTHFTTVGSLLMKEVPKYNFFAFGLIGVAEISLSIKEIVYQTFKGNLSQQDFLKKSSCLVSSVPLILLLSPSAILYAPNILVGAIAINSIKKIYEARTIWKNENIWENEDESNNNAAQQKLLILTCEIMKDITTLTAYCDNGIGNIFANAQEKNDLTFIQTSASIASIAFAGAEFVFTISNLNENTNRL